MSREKGEVSRVRTNSRSSWNRYCILRLPLLELLANNIRKGYKQYSCLDLYRNYSVSCF